MRTLVLRAALPSAIRGFAAPAPAIGRSAAMAIVPAAVATPTGASGAR